MSSRTVLRFISHGETSYPMPRDDWESLERRVAAIERALGNGETDRRSAVTATTGDDEDGRVDRRADLEGRVGDLETRIDRLTDRYDDLVDRLDRLDAGLQAVRGFLGGVDAVNESVERRADAAIAAVERLEAHVDGPDGSRLDPGSSTAPRAGNPDDPSENGGRTTIDSDDAGTASLRERLRSLR